MPCRVIPFRGQQHAIAATTSTQQTCTISFSANKYAKYLRDIEYATLTILRLKFKTEVLTISQQVLVVCVYFSDFFFGRQLQVFDIPPSLMLKNLTEKRILSLRIEP